MGINLQIPEVLHDDVLPTTLTMASEAGRGGRYWDKTKNVKMNILERLKSLSGALSLPPGLGTTTSTRRRRRTLLAVVEGVGRVDLFSSPYFVRKLTTTTTVTTWARGGQETNVRQREEVCLSPHSFLCTPHHTYPSSYFRSSSIYL